MVDRVFVGFQIRKGGETNKSCQLYKLVPAEIAASGADQQLWEG
jgi:hypothetical protein